MVFKTTFTNGRAFRRKGGFALAEAFVTVGIVALVMLAVATFSMFSSRSFVTLFNYVDLDDVNRLAVDQLTRDVRQAQRVKEATATRLVLEDSDSGDLVYEYSSGTRTLKRTKNTDVRTILTQCDRLAFAIGQRNTVGGTYDVYPAATADTAKVVNVSWSCSRTIFGRKENTESVQTARIVIRKQGK